MADMNGKVALVTGAAHGIGRASALALARAGASVCVADIDAAAGESVANEIVAADGRAFYQPCDVRSADDARAMVAATLAEYGRLDAAVNNAGIAGSFDHRLHEAADNMLDAVLAVNLRGVWNCLKAELDVMLPQGSGAIVNMASVAGLIGAPKSGSLHGQQARGGRHHQVGGAGLCAGGLAHQCSLPGLHRYAHGAGGCGGRSAYGCYHVSSHPHGQAGHSGRNRGGRGMALLGRIVIRDRSCADAGWRAGGDLGRSICQRHSSA